MVYLGADHRGFELKEALKRHLGERGIAFQDFGAKEKIPDDDFVDYALAVAQAVAREPEEHLGVVICGTGVGVDMAANKVKGIRAGLGFTADQAVHARRADAMNVIALSSEYLTLPTAIDIVDKWIDTPLASEDRYQRRLKKLAAWEDEVFK